MRRVLCSLRHVGLEVTPEPEIGAEGFVAHVTDEWFHGTQELLVPLQLLVRGERLAAFLAGPQARVLAGRRLFGGRAGLRRHVLGFLRGLLFDLDLQLLRKAQVFGKTGGVFRIEVDLLRTVAERVVLFGGDHVVCLLRLGLGLGLGGAGDFAVVVLAGQGEVFGGGHGVLIVDFDLVPPDAEGGLEGAHALEARQLLVLTLALVLVLELGRKEPKAAVGAHGGVPAQSLVAALL